MIAVKHTGPWVTISAFLLVLISCTDLNIDNLNSPDTRDILATSEEMINYVGDAFRIWYNGVNGYESPALAMSAMADQITMSWGTAGCYTLASEPRQGFNNSATFVYAFITYDFWKQMYTSLALANDVLKRIEGEGVKVISNGQDVTGMVKAWCYFIQGITHGSLGMFFDKAFVLDWNTDFSDASFIPYTEVEKMSLVFLDKAIATIDASSDFTLPDGYIRGYNLTSAEFRKLVNSFAAQIMAYTPRNTARNAAVNWSKVLDYAQAGIDFDLTPAMDDLYWTDTFLAYGTFPGWARIDCRIINLMDHDYPSRWPDDNISWNTPDGEDPGPASSSDARLISDFEFLSDNNFRPERGYYFFSHYRSSRFDWFLKTWKGPVPAIWKWENDLLIAEALVRSGGDVAGAIAILNDPNGARKARGMLPDVSPSSVDETLEVIFYERDIELIFSRSGISFFDMRRRDMLQRGTILHFPVPGAELEILGLPYYTISGAPEGENISDGSWTGYDGLTSPPE